MSDRMHALAQALLGKNTLEECDLQEIRELTTRYPYHAPAQFLLLSKLKALGSPDYTAQLQKAVLYYQDPLAFEHFMDSDRFHTDIDLRERPSDSAIDTTHAEPEPSVTMLQTDGGDISEQQPAEETEAASVAEEIPQPSLEVITPAPPPADEAPLAFEPYHTVDYFASQGIKLSQEEAPKDKFGMQLKSFTEWLKTMKRLPANQVSKVDIPTEKKVEHMAEDSVHTADVVTEAMAEVWLKQGNREKAIETYNKLSLQNPSKRAYFAALIENLKHS